MPGKNCAVLGFGPCWRMKGVGIGRLPLGRRKLVPHGGKNGLKRLRRRGICIRVSRS